jgi:fluoroacetyl-CoA thioesterase
MDSLKPGMRHTQEWVVEEKHTTQRGDYRVFSTPSMTQLVESTANQLAAPHLKPGQGQVGVLVTVRHMGPTPMGKMVRAEAELVAIDRRKLTFKVKVYDDAEQVGEADHDRFVIDLDKYYEKLRKKIG